MTVSVFIMDSTHSPVHLRIGSRKAVLPVGRDTEIDEIFLPLLGDSLDVKWRFTGEPGTVEAAEQSAPAVALDFNADAIIDGSTSEVAERLSGLDAEQLLAVRRAEEDREVARKGVITAINKAINAANEG
jgi:hypothetical protein